MIRSVANLTRADGEDFMSVAEELPIITTVTPMRLEDANEALDQMRTGRLKGAAVLVPT
jgi:propanol-preferring alcohol dehydrogenase